MFYDKFKQLCEKKGVSVNKACVEIGLSRSAAAKWKATNAGTPTAETCKKIAAYFGITVSDLLDETNKVENMSALDIEFDKLISEMSDDEKRLALGMIKTIKENRK